MSSAENERPKPGSSLASMAGFKPVASPVTPSKVLKTKAEYQACLEEGERWIEFDRGDFQRHEAPDSMHGNIVRNLTAAFSKVLKADAKYFPCFELPIVLQEEPLTIRVPAISFFPVADGFGVLDEVMTAKIPTFVIEIASSRLRREGMSQRVKDYTRWGVKEIWVIDPTSKHAHQFSDGLPPRMVKETETMHGRICFPELQVLVMDLFSDPEWLGH